jgi:hypothetical protein
MTVNNSININKMNNHLSHQIIFIECGLFEWKWICAGFICLSISVLMLEVRVSRGVWLGFHLPVLTWPHFCTTDFQRICHGSFYLWFNDLMWKVIVHFVNIDGIVISYILHLKSSIWTGNYKNILKFRDKIVLETGNSTILNESNSNIVESDVFKFTSPYKLVWSQLLPVYAI